MATQPWPYLILFGFEFIYGLNISFNLDTQQISVTTHVFGKLCGVPLTSDTLILLIREIIP